MAAKLQCEICGGKLVGKPGGIYECDSCGTEYSTEWAKAKIQEIIGTVKIEGKVQIDDDSKRDNLLKRGFMFLEEGNWNSADEYFDRVLDLDVECGEAYLGKLMAELRVKTREALKELPESFDDRGNYQKVMRFGNESLRVELASIRNKNEKARQETIEKFRQHSERYRRAKGMISAGALHTASVDISGNVRVVKAKGIGKSDVSGWKNVIAVSAGTNHTIGLRKDKTVVSTRIVGNQQLDRGQCEVANWKEIIAISASTYHSVGLRADGTVVATMYRGASKDNHGQCNVSNWTNMIEISSSVHCTAGLKSDGTVTIAGGTNEMRASVSGWNGIVAISAGSDHVVGLHKDGTVIAAGLNSAGQCNVSDWKGIIAIAAGGHHTVGLRADGTVVATKDTGDPKKNHGQGDVFGWSDIVAISAGLCHTVGLRADGTVVSTVYSGDQGFNFGQCDIPATWKLFSSFDSLEE